MKVDLAITFCCKELQIEMVKREWWLSIDTENDKIKLVPSEDESLWRETCPFCNRTMEDVVDVDIDSKGVLLR